LGGGIGADGNHGLGDLAVIKDDTDRSCKKPVITRVLDLALEDEMSAKSFLKR